MKKEKPPAGNKTPAESIPDNSSTQDSEKSPT